MYSKILTVSTQKNTRSDLERREVTDKETQVIFESLRFAKATPAQYWVPLIGAYSGMRQSEICQLYRSDVQDIDGVWCFNVNRDGEKRLKTANSARIIPIHREILRLGFLKFVNSGKSQRLFQELPFVNGKAGHAFSKWFGKLKLQLIKEGKLSAASQNMTFHGFRHTVATKMRNAEIAESMAAEVLGHETGAAMTYTRYAKRSQIEPLVKAVESIRYGTEESPIRK